MYSPNVKTFRQDNFLGGLNCTDSPDNILDHQAVDTWDMMYKDGVLQTRYGMATQFAAGVLTGTVLGMYTYQASGSTDSALYIVNNRNIYHYNTTAVTSIFSGMATATVTRSFKMEQNMHQSNTLFFSQKTSTKKNFPGNLWKG